MIKLIVCDIDGTLIPYGETALSPALFPLIRRLEARGVAFCPASGRQYHSLRGLFAPVADELYYLCENGAAVFGPGGEEDAPLLAKTPMPQADALALSHAILALPDREVLISGRNTSYVSHRNPAFAARMRSFTGNHVRAVERPEEVPEEILKVSAFCSRGMDETAAALGPRWGESYRMAVAGPNWLDFTLADKGMGLASLCDIMGITAAETAAFGDNWNDLPMLRRAGRAYLMEQAPAALREELMRPCRRVEDSLVELLEEEQC